MLRLSTVGCAGRISSRSGRGVVPIFAGSGIWSLERLFVGGLGKIGMHAHVVIIDSGFLVSHWTLVSPRVLSSLKHHEMKVCCI